MLGCFSVLGQDKIFDVHVHGSPEPTQQINELSEAGIYKLAISTSWNIQQEYKTDKLVVLRGLMIPCPLGKVPYSGQQCFDDGKEWPSLTWVEAQIQKGDIHFLGEVLSQYHGISPSDSLLLPFYQLAKKYNLPVGIHTGSAGPNHGCPNFNERMGNPLLMRDLLHKIPTLKVWIMHAGVPYLQETIQLMKEYPHLYADISAINNPEIVPEGDFASIMKLLIENGLEDRIMFGSDNNNIDVTINSIRRLQFLTEKQKQKIFFINAETLFATVP
jgi:hypothetical protein